MNLCSHKNSLLAGGAGLHVWLVAVVLQSPAKVTAQEALRNAVAVDAAAASRPINLESLPYTFKSGDFRLLVTPSLGAEWNDNINTANTNTLQDYILRPMLQLNANYPITQVNLLRLDVGFGYADYLQHHEYSSWQVNSGSQLSFDTYIKDILINLHERFDYTQDTGSQAVVAGTGTFGTSRNVAGVSVTWNPKDINTFLGYDHQNVMSTSGQFQSQDSTAELIDGRVGWRFIPTATVGVEGTCSLISYDQAILNNNTAYTAGLYGEWHPGTYFRVTSRAGYVIYDFQNTSEAGETINGMTTNVPIQTADTKSWYGNVTLSHDVTRFLSYSLSAGHEIQMGVESDAIAVSYLRLASTWKIIKNLDLHGSFSYEHGQQGIGNVSGNLTEIYDWYNGGLDLSHQITSRLRMSLNSRVAFRASSADALEYTQVMVGLQMVYAFQ
jgi:hypothetical protein